MEVLKEMGKLDASSGELREEKALLEDIVRKCQEVPHSDSNSRSIAHDESRENSPGVPLKETQRKRKTKEDDIGRESSPDEPLMAVRKRKKMAADDEQRDCGPGVALRGACKTKRLKMSEAHISTMESARRHAV